MYNIKLKDSPIFTLNLTDLSVFKLNLSNSGASITLDNLSVYNVKLTDTP